MKTSPSFLPFFPCVVLMTGLLAGCGTSPTPTANRMGGSTEYMAGTPAPDAVRPHPRTREREHVERTTATTSKRIVKAKATPTPSGKVQAEIHDPSEIKIDDETRQRMAPGDKKPKKVESEVKNPTDVQIDDQTRQEMDKPH